MSALLISAVLFLLSPAQAAPAGAVISGRVVEAGNGQPVRRVIVTATGGNLVHGKSAVTDDDGRFKLAGLPDGDFTLTATRPGFLKASFGASRQGRPGTPITIRSGASRADVAITMTRGSALAGVIRDIAGDPAPGMRVEAIRILHLSTGDRAEKLGEAQADDRGEFRIFGLPAGDYVLAATPRVIVGGMGAVGAPTEAEIDAKLNALRSKSSLPSPSAGAPPPASPVPGQDKGYATPAVFYPGVITPAEAVVVTLGANESREGLDFGTRLSHAATVDGVVVAARGITLPQIQLSIQGNGPQLPVAGGSMSSGPSIRMDNGTHTFTITNVPPGHYKLNAKTTNVPGNSSQAMASGGALPTQYTGTVLWGTVEFDVIGDDVSGVSLTVQPAPTVTGRIAMDAAAVNPLKNLSGARVSLQPVPDSDRRSNGLSSPITTTAGANGAFELAAVIPGAYRVSATLPTGWWLRSAAIGPNAADILDGILTVGADGVADLTMTISDRHPSVAGTLTTAGGPASEYFLVAFTSDKSMWRAPSRRVRSMRPTTTGAFEVTDLPPGQYYLAALKDLDPADLEDPAFLESLIPAAALVTVTEGQKTIQDLRIGG